MRKSQGFSLIELLIVVAIILIIAAIAIPSLMRARIAANESAMVGDMRAVVSAEQTFCSTASAYAPIACLPHPSACFAAAGVAPMIDVALADTTLNKSGYDREFFPGAATLGGLLQGYVYGGVPVSPGRTGVKGFAADYTGRICWMADGTIPPNSGGALDPCASPLGG
jgi:type IV pilus assembly protein PilA